MFRSLTSLFACLLCAFHNVAVEAEDWPRFRGPGGGGVASDSESLPTAWSPKANLAWKTALPGPGASSPIVVGERVFVTCYSGYGLNMQEPGEIENLVRHLICLNLKTGEQLWQREVSAALPEDSYIGSGVSSHGYASHTPVSDGKRVFAFFGKSGVHAFDLEGNKLWQAEVGMESDPPGWGSASSPIVFHETLIITASAESQAVIGLDTTTGEERWRQEASGLDGMWGTPTLAEVDDTRTDLVMFVPKEIWGLDPNSGKLRWYADALGSQQAYASVIAEGSRVFAVTGRGGGSIALDAGGRGEVSDTGIVWTGRTTTTYATPVRYDSKLYVVSRGILTVVDATSGTQVQQIRLQDAQQTGGPFGSLDYPSPIVAGDRLFYLNASGQVFVFTLDDVAQQVAINRVTLDKETFWGSPAVSQGRLILRSSKHLYCVMDQGDPVQPDDNVIPRRDTDAPSEDGQRVGGRQRGSRLGNRNRQRDPDVSDPRPKRPLRPESTDR